MRVQEIMNREVKVCGQNDTLNVAAQLMWEHDCGCVPVLASDGNGAVVGIVTDRDVCMATYTQGKALFEIPVITAMAHKVIACKPDDDLKSAEALMRENRVRRLPVLDEKGIIQGIISINDIARAAERERAAGRKIPQVSDTEVAETLAGVCHPYAELQPITKAAA